MHANVLNCIASIFMANFILLLMMFEYFIIIIFFGVCVHGL